jgi:hypothetical protein
MALSRQLLSYHHCILSFLPHPQPAAQIAESFRRCRALTKPNGAPAAQGKQGL